MIPLARVQRRSAFEEFSGMDRSPSFFLIEPPCSATIISYARARADPPWA